MIISFEKLAGASAILPQRRLSNLRTIGHLNTYISRVQYFAIFGGKVSCRLDDRVPQWGVDKSETLSASLLTKHILHVTILRHILIDSKEYQRCFRNYLVERVHFNDLYFWHIWCCMSDLSPQIIYFTKTRWPFSMLSCYTHNLLCVTRRWYIITDWSIFNRDPVYTKTGIQWNRCTQCQY